MKTNILRCIFSISKEAKYRVVNILGIKIKWRSSLLVLQNRVSTLEAHMASLLGDISNVYSSGRAVTAADTGEPGNDDTQLSDQESILKSIKALESMIQRLQNENITRLRKLEKSLTYKINQYCPDEKRELALQDWYKQFSNKKINFRNPSTYNEKIQWSKLYDSTPFKSLLADKYLVREWVANKIGEQYLIPLLGVWERFEDIDFNALPDRFALKCNHGSAYNIIVKDKNSLNLKNVKQMLDAWMAEDYSFKAGFELHYSAIPRRIIAEEFIENKASKGDLYDYKFWCFNGKVAYIQMFSERYTNGVKAAFYDVEWKKQKFTYGRPLDEKNIPKPDNLDEMIRLAEVLADGINHVRVDFYRMDDGKLYFGEMTFTPTSGTAKWNPASMNLVMGDMFKLPMQNNKELSNG